MFSYKVFQDLCEKNNVTPYQVSVATGVATSTLTNWKNGGYTPKADKVLLIANHFGVGIEKFIKHGEENT